jgi:hypothetical protein
MTGTAFRPRHFVHPVDRIGSWTTNHRKYYDRAHFALGELTIAAKSILDAWPDTTRLAIAVDQLPPEIHGLCLRRDTFADAVVMLAAMSAEAFLNFYGVVRLGSEQFGEHFEMLQTERKLRVLLLICDAVVVTRKDPIVVAIRSLMDRRNALAHPKAREVEPDLPAESRAGPPLPEGAAEVLEECTRFFRLFLGLVPAASHLVPDLRVT